MQVDFPCLPGLFAFREMPPLLQALGKLTVDPGLLMRDGHGYAHPRRLGLASCIGVLTGLPAISVARTLLCGHAEELPDTTRHADHLARAALARACAPPAT